MTLVTERTAITPGQPIEAGILLEAKEGWHTYWQNPGDAGIPTSLTWTLPESFSAGAIDWPVPQRLTEGPLVTYSYLGTVFLPVTITPPATLDSKASYPLKVKVEVLVCKEICVPESAELQITLPVAATEASLTADAGLFAQNRAHHTQKLDAAGQFTTQGNRLTLTLPAEALSSSNIASAQFFAREQNIITYAAPQTLRLSKDTLTLSMDRTEEQPGNTVSGILALTASDGTQTAYDISFANASLANAPPAPETPLFSVILSLALLGGLVLNLMPCVLPILSLKALAIAKKSGGTHSHVIRLGIAYTLGIMVSFALIAGLLLALRGAGESIGWGYQMQSPAFVGFLIYLLFMVGLNLSDVFHLPVLLGNTGNRIASESTARGSFLTGVLATAVATPCTAPFMASAVGAALTMPTWQALLVFEALGFGLALPFLLISLFPSLRRLLPKPGAWMNRFKHWLAIPMYASVGWLLWVLALQTGRGGALIALYCMFIIVVTIGLKPWFRAGSPRYRTTALITYALILCVSLPLLSRSVPPAMVPSHTASANEVQTVPYSKLKLAELRQAGKPVFVDATAAWCITCQVNARVALNTQRTMAEFKRQGITLMIADWTRRNDDITEFLSSFGYSGVPLCVFYPAANGQPVVLSQLLSEDTVLGIINPQGN